MNKVKCFLKSEDGPTVVEYAIILAVIILVAVIGIAGIGNKVEKTFATIDQNIITVDDNSQIGMGSVASE